MKLLRAIGALALLSILLLGVPVLLLAWGDPLALLNVNWSTALIRPDDGTVLLGILSLVGWVAWLFVLITAVLEGVETLSRGRLTLSLPGTGWLRPVVGSLVAAAVAPFLTLGTTAHAESAAPPAAAAPPMPITPQAGNPLTPQALNPLLPQAPIPAERPLAPSDTSPSTIDYHVQDGDELWSLAETHLGSGHRWREITALNPGVTATSELLVGSVLKIPAEPENRIEVLAGDTLWDLAEEHLGDAQQWPRIHAENSNLIEDPDHIQTGWVISLPEQDREAESASEADDAGDHAVEDIPESAGAETPGAEAPGPGPQRPTGEHEAEAAPPEDPLTEVPPTEAPPEDEAAEQPAELPSDDAVEAEQTDSPGVAEILGPIGSVLATGLFVGIAARRRLQLLHRAVGSRLVPFAPRLQQFVSALGRSAHQAEEADPALRSTSVMIGWRDDEPLHLDLETAGLTVVTGDTELCVGLAAGVITGLMCSPWSTSVSVTAVQPDQSWETALDDPRLTSHDHLAEALKELQQTVARRRIALRETTLDQVRQDPDRHEAFAPHVVVFCQPVKTAQLQQIRDCLALGEVGVSVLATTRRAGSATSADTMISLTSEESALYNGSLFAPQLLTLPARRAIVELFAAALDPASEPAPWWQDDVLPSNVSVLPRRRAHQDQEEPMPPWNENPAHPTLLLLGEVDLIGFRGKRPPRSINQCLEYCTWLLEHPGASPTTMARDLLVAEPTRRSNISRLRTWLGADVDDEPYLPDAYSGRVDLSGDVTSDWEHFQLLLSGGIPNASDLALRTALGLVRGEPLHLLGFQWPWAEQLRTDMLSMITDTAVVLSDRYLEVGDIEGARWALERGIRAVGDDETLAAREITALALLGDRAGVDRAVRKVTRAARAEGRDLAAETARRIQDGLHLVLTADGASS